MLKFDGVLTVNGNALKTRMGVVVAVVSTGLSPEEAQAYLNVFVSSQNLLRSAEQTVTAMLAGFEAQEKRISTQRLGGYSAGTRYRGFPNWFERAVQTVARANG